MWIQSRGRLILTSTSSSLRRGKLQKPVGGNQPAAARKERRDGMLIPEGNTRGDGSSLRILGNPPQTNALLWARSATAKKEGGGERRGSRKLRLNLGSLRRGRTTKRLPRFGRREGGAGGRGGCVKLTAALNPSSWRGLDPIRPAQPRTAWQGLSCRRHQRADEDGGQSVRPPATPQTWSFRQKAGRQQFAAVRKTRLPASVDSRICFAFTLKQRRRFNSSFT